MRPVKLTMQAFGSYGKLTQIDFREPNQNLFLVTGDTGAGKTTIFDAIVFALYGETSSSTNKKEGVVLQSQYVELNVEPFVELVFSEGIGEDCQFYTVRRVPRHLKLLTRGAGKNSGSREVAGSVSLTMPDGTEYPQKEADSKLGEILGLTKSQFMQVAMIAQGEFMELLRARSDDKKVIFRKLFNTELYQNIVEELMNRKRSLEKDIAQIKREYPKLNKYIKSNGNKCVLLSIEMRPGNDIVKMGRDVHKMMDDFEQSLPGDVHINTITDQSKVVSESVLNFLRELLISVISVIIVVILLMPRRVAEVSALSIPITIFSSVGIFYLFGMELNTVTLAALIVTLGMVVDDSVVIIDNYMEKLGHGMSRWHAAIAAPREFFMSVLSATLCISLTFFPFLFTMHGDMGDFVKSFPWAMFIILSISLMVSLLLTPYLQYMVIHQGISSQHKPNARKKPLDYLQMGYTWLLKRCFAFPRTTLAVGIMLVSTGAIIFVHLPQRMMPIAERNQFAVEFYLPSGTTAARTAQVADSMAHILQRDPQVTAVTTFVGQGSPRFHTTYAPQIGGENFAQFIVNTVDNDATEEVLDRYADRYSNYFPDCYIRFKQMDYNNATYPIEVRVSGDSMGDLKAAARKIEACMHKIEGINLIRTNYEEPLPGIRVTPDATEANRLGVNKTILSADLAIHFGDGIPMATLWEGDYPVKMVLKSENDSDLANEYIPVMGGTSSVPLRQLAKISPDWHDGSIIRRNGVRTISIIGEPLRGFNANQLANELKQEVSKLPLDSSLDWEIGGMAEKDAETLPQVTSGVMIAALIIFFILLFHFKRISLALVNLSSMSLCIFGAAIGLLVTGFDVSLTCILGIVSLMGILVRNGIIMLDYAEELRRDKGLSVKEAAFQAGERRMRPIFLTSAAASVGVLPMMVENNTLWSPMGAVIFFGTLISMVLIATILPVLYWLVFDKHGKYSLRKQ